MPRILAIDPGSKRIGFALSDELGATARPLCVLKAQSTEQDVQRVLALIEEHEAEEVLFGMPYRQDGSESLSTQKARVFKNALEAQLSGIPLKERDETLTTWEAEQRLIAQGLSPKQRKEVIDSHAAMVLLEEELQDRGTALAPMYDSF